MKALQQLCGAAVFILVLTSATFGGDISTGGKTEPPPPPTSSTTAPGERQTEQDLQNPEVMSDSVVDIALNLLHTMLLVF